ncbi:hypothetical protein V5O48_016085 [Marasmius crinis-equi]|uniref:Uncharacterized protein n=1 Tax=Marasmius crinis-equi TaxID=585013 RepID=A0ABR3ESS6_9AGAR
MPIPLRNTAPRPNYTETAVPPLYLRSEAYYDSDSDSSLPALDPVSDSEDEDDQTAQPPDSHSSGASFPSLNDEAIADGRVMEWLVELAQAARGLTRYAVSRGERVVFDWTDETLQVVYDTTQRVSANGEPVDPTWMSEFFVDRGSDRARFTYERPIPPPRSMNQPTDPVWLQRLEASGTDGEGTERDWHREIVLRRQAESSRDSTDNTQQQDGLTSALRVPALPLD